MERLKRIEEILKTQFEIDLFEASIASLNDKSNKLRYNNFAYSIRELSRHFLKTLAPDSNVKACIWYKQETKNGDPTRAQRIKYAIQGGVNDETLKNIGLEISDLEKKTKAVVDCINSLSKYTHINPEVFDLTDNDVDKNSELVLDTFEEFVNTINEYRSELKKFLDGNIEEKMIESTIYNFFENIDRLAPHNSLESLDVTDYHIEEINDQEIIVSVSGYLNVLLEYGSRKERREGDGLDIEQTFPYKTKIRYEISEYFPSDRCEIDEYDVDTSSWYE